MKKQYTQKDLHDSCLPCEEKDCQDCCTHDEFDHYICLDCGYEKDPGEDIDAAEYIVDPER